MKLDLTQPLEKKRRAAETKTEPETESREDGKEKTRTGTLIHTEQAVVHETENDRKTTAELRKNIRRGDSNG